MLSHVIIISLFVYDFGKQKNNLKGDINYYLLYEETDYMIDPHILLRKPISINCPFCAKQHQNVIFNHITYTESSYGLIITHRDCAIKYFFKFFTDDTYEDILFQARLGEKIIIHQIMSKFQFIENWDGITFAIKNGTYPGMMKIEFEEIDESNQQDEKKLESISLDEDSVIEEELIQKDKPHQKRFKRVHPLDI